MKKIFIYIFVFCIIIMSCGKDDDQVPQPNNAPDSFNLLGVPNSTINVSQQPTLSWEAATDIDNDQVVYDVYLEDFSSSTILIVPGDPPQNPTKIIAQGISETSITLDKLPLSARINWKVVARDNKGAATESEVFKFRTRGINIRENAMNPSAAFEARYGHQVVFFKDRFWLIGGLANIEDQKNDVWSSVDGKEWILETVDAGFEPRLYASAVVFQNKIWVIGGLTNAGTVSDIWSSEDGINWKQETAEAPFGTKVQSALVVQDDKLYLIGGIKNFTVVGNIDNEVWSSTDGKVWNLETMNAPYSAQYGYETIVFNDQIFVIGGANLAGEYFNEVWSSRNGKDWTKANHFNKFSRRAYFNTTVFDNKIWLTGGGFEDMSGDKRYNDLWFSRDGTNWQRQTENANYSFRRGTTMTSNNDRILLIAGNEIDGDNVNDIWLFD